MEMFDIDAEAARAAFVRQGWAHLPGAARPAFVADVRERVAAVLAGQLTTVGGNAANKVQFRLDFDDLRAVQQEVLSTFGPVGGYDPYTLTLSERHINVYRDNATPDPVPHKDRRASQLTIGVTIDVRPGSHLVLWPETDRTENAYESAAAHHASLPVHARPENLLLHTPPVEVHDHPGDVVLFAGSTTWHCRRMAAGTTNLFFKCNDFGDDPLGEDVRAVVAALAG